MPTRAATTRLHCVLVKRVGVPPAIQAQCCALTAQCRFAKTASILAVNAAASRSYCRPISSKPTPNNARADTARTITLPSFYSTGGAGIARCRELAADFERWRCSIGEDYRAQHCRLTGFCSPYHRAGPLSRSYAGFGARLPLTQTVLQGRSAALLMGVAVAEWHAPNWYFRGVLR